MPISKEDLRKMTAYVYKNNTKRLEMRYGDQLFWSRWTIDATKPSILDVWSPADGDSVLITNVTDDFPEWFDLHPTEVADELAFWMVKRIADGYQPTTPVDGPNIWRLLEGDRLVWTGEYRRDPLPDADTHDVLDGILAVFQVHSNSLAAGLSHDGDVLRWCEVNDSPECMERGFLAIHVLDDLGMPRHFSADTTWKLS